jgi:predicted aspartyl protease
VSDPKITVFLRTAAGDISAQFVVDTGAEFSAAPRRLANQIGLDWDGLPEVIAAGVEQAPIVARLGRLPMRIGGTELEVQCLFVDSPSAPSLLGRAGCLDRFVLTIDPRQQKIILDPLL